MWQSMHGKRLVQVFENNKDLQSMKKGHTNNPNGRPKGTPNKITQDVRQWISTVIEDNRQQMEQDLKAIEPKDRLIILERLMQYIVPRQQAVSAEVGIKQGNITLTERLKILAEGGELPPCE